MTDVQGISASLAPSMGDTTQSSFADPTAEATQDDLRRSVATADTTLADDSQLDNGTAEDGTATGGVAKNIYLATYSSVAVFELMVRGIACMRRRTDGYINATQILKIAGIDKAKRTKILEKEILTGEHEKVQGGYGKYQGTWIPLKRAQELSATYLVAHLLQPLLEFDPAKAGSVPVAGKRKRPNPNAPSASMHFRQGPGAQQMAAAKGVINKSNVSNSASATKNDSLTSTTTAALNESAPGPSQQPRFISLRPPPGLNGSLESSNLVFPRGTTAEQRETLSKFASHGYTPQGVSLPTSKIQQGEETIPSTKRGADSAFDDNEGERGAKRQRADGATEVNGFESSSSFMLGPSPVKDLNALGRSTSPTSALRGARAPTRLHRVALGPPDEFRQLQLDGTRFADRPQTLHEGDEAERRMRSKLLQMFVDERLQQADAEDQTGLVTSPDERKLEELLNDLRVAAQSVDEPQNDDSMTVEGTNVKASETTQTNGHIIDMSAPPPCVDLVIDDHGHTALHWSAALAKVSYVRLLTARAPSSGGANTHAGNHAGETALHRTVLVSNAYDSSTFPALIHLLKPSLHTRDYRKRTVLHHIALISSVKGRGVAARYYLACILEFIAKHQGGRYAALIDAQDDEGETALSIVARIGNVSMIKMLLDVGARKDIANDLGLKASDWGIDSLDQSGNTNENKVSNGVPDADGQATTSSSKDKPTEAVTALTRPPRAPVQKSKDVLEQMTTVLQDLTDVFQKELTDKEDALQVASAHLKSATRELALRRKKIAESQAHVAERDEARMRKQNLTKVLLEEISGSSNFEDVDEERIIAQSIQSTANEDLMDLDEKAIEEAPFKNTSSGAEEDKLFKLRWLEDWYEKDMKSLQDRIESLESAGQSKMEQCRKVVAMCCSVEEEKVESMLEELVSAIESIGSEGVDLPRLAGFLSKVKEIRS